MTVCSLALYFLWLRAKEKPGLRSQSDQNGCHARASAFAEKVSMKKSGFTLIELLIVIVIIGILATIAIPQYQKMVDRSRLAEGFSMVEAIKRAISMYRLENNKSPWLGPSGLPTVVGTDINALGLNIEIPPDAYFEYFITRDPVGNPYNMDASIDNLRIGGRNPYEVFSSNPASLSLNANESGERKYKLRNATTVSTWP